MLFFTLTVLAIVVGSSCAGKTITIISFGVYKSGPKGKEVWGRHILPVARTFLLCFVAMPCRAGHASVQQSRGSQAPKTPTGCARRWGEGGRGVPSNPLTFSPCYIVLRTYCLI